MRFAPPDSPRDGKGLKAELTPAPAASRGASACAARARLRCFPPCPLWLLLLRDTIRRGLVRLTARPGARIMRLAGPVEHGFKYQA